MPPAPAPTPPSPPSLLQIGNNSSVWYGAVVRGDVASVKIGSQSNIQVSARTAPGGGGGRDPRGPAGPHPPPAPRDARRRTPLPQDNAVIHVTRATKDGARPAIPVVIGDRVTVGHGATVHGATVEDETLIGMGATVMDGAVVEKHSMVAAGAVVPQNVRVKSGQIWAGNPARFLRDLTPEEKAFLSQSAGNYVSLAETHRAENAKTFEEVERDKQLRRERGGFVAPADLEKAASGQAPVTH